jgi:hypothetical protein
VLTGQGPSCPACLHPTPLCPQGPARPVVAQSQTESCWRNAEGVSRLSSPPPHNREDGRRQMWGSPSNSMSHIPGRETSSWNGGKRQCRILSYCPSSKRATPRMAPIGDPVLFVPSREGWWSAENVCLMGDKSLNLGARGAAGRGSSSLGDSPHQVGKTKARAGGLGLDSCLGALMMGQLG